MEEYQKRVVIEKHGLDDKIERLAAFMGSEAFMKLNDIDKMLLERQLYFMNGYMDILNRRIERFDKTAKE
jgi:hypothetical protein